MVDSPPVETAPPVEAVKTSFPFQVQFQYESRLFAKAARVFVFTQYRWYYILVLIATLLSLTLWILKGQASIYPVLTPAILLMAPLFAMALGFNTYWNCKKLLAKLEDPTVTFTFRENHLAIQMDQSHGENHWKYFHRFIISPDVCLLFINARSFYVIPTSLLPDGAIKALRAIAQQYQISWCEI